MTILCIFLLLLTFVARPKKTVEIVTILCMSLLLLTFAGCSHSNSNFARQWPALHYYENKAPTEQNLQQYLVDLNRQQGSVPFTNGGLNFSYTLLNW